MGDGARTIGSMRVHDDVEDWIVDAFVAQRARLRDTARSLDAAEWERPSRCTAWTSHQLVIHVLGATAACRTTLTGERSAFGGGFDPNTGPTTFVDQRTGEPVTRTLDDLAREITATADVIAGMRGRDPMPQCTAVWGAEVDWRLFVTHMFWDGWMHERDLLLALGRPAPTTEAEAGLATAYALHSAGIMCGLTGTPIDVTLQLGDTGAGEYRLVAQGGDVRVTVGPMGEPRAAMGDAPVVTDAIAGRPPGLADALRAPADVLEPLGRLAGFLNA